MNKCLAILPGAVISVRTVLTGFYSSAGGVFSFFEELRGWFERERETNLLLTFFLIVLFAQKFMKMNATFSVESLSSLIIPAF